MGLGEEIDAWRKQILALQNAPTSATEFFTLIRSLPSDKERTAYLQQLVDAEANETEWLEFKAAGHVGEPKADPQNDEWLRGEFSKYVSALANTSGGIVIWGIETGKKTGKDCAKKFNHVRFPSQFKSRLDSFRMGATDSPVAGVENLAVVDPASGSGVGCVVTYIPNSPHKPHRALQGERTNFIRVGDECGPIANDLLRFMFYPRLNVSFEIVSNHTLLQNNVVQLDLTLKNSGKGSARELACIIKAFSGMKLNSFGAPYSWDQTIVHATANLRAKQTLHPGETVMLVWAQYQMEPYKTHTLEVEFAFYFLDGDPQYYRLSYADQDFVRRRPKVAQQVPSLEPEGG